MDEERPSNEAETIISTSNDADSSESTAPANRPSGLMIGGVVLVLALIIAGLFLPPISLGQRLGFGGDEAETAVESPTETPAENQTAVPGEFAVSVADGSGVNVAGIAAADVAGAGIAAPTDFSVQSNVYTVATETPGAAGQVAVAYAEGADTRMLDLYGWNGTAWRFVPSQVDPANQQVVSALGPLQQAYALGMAAAGAPRRVGADVESEQSLPAEVTTTVTDLTVGVLTLVGTGEVQGELASAPDGSFAQLMRVSNAGAVVDQASLATFLADSTAQSNQINALVNTAVSNGYAGVHLDYQGVSAAQQDAFTAYVSMLADALRAQGLQLAVSLGAPTQSGASWDTAGQDWAALGQLADWVYVQMPLDPTAYAAGGDAESLLDWATRQIDRRRMMMSVHAGAVDRIGESFTALSNEDALANFGELQFVAGGETVEPETAVELVLSGSATPLEWDGASLTYTYSYGEADQTHFVWLGNPAALSQRLMLASTFNLVGMAVRGLGDVADGAGYAAALAAANGAGTPPETTGAAIVWTVRDGDDSVIASESGSDLTFAWEGGAAGTYTVNAEFALGDAVAPLDSVTIAVETAEVAEDDRDEADEETAEVEEAPAEEETESTPAAFDPGAADAITNSNANVRVGPGLGYGLIAGGAAAGTQVQLLGRNSDASWLQVRLPDSQEGWIFSTLLTVNDGVNVSALDVIEVDPPAVSETPGGGGDGGSSAAPPPVAAPPVAGNSGFELGGQIFGAPYGMMSYAGMTWVKRQQKWSPGLSPSSVQGMISEAHNAGFKILLSIPGQVYPSALPDFGAYTEFLRGVASLPDPPDAIEIWNEMNIDAEWPPGQINPASYVNNMLAPGYNAIKSANANIMVISGAPAPTGFFGGGCGTNGCDDEPYMRGMAAAGAANYMDCIGVHYNEGIISPNQSSGDPRSDHYTRYYSGMVNAYYNAFGGARPLCFTEIGYLTPEGYGGLPGGFAWAQNTSVAEQAQWLAEAVSLSANSGKVRMFIVWNVDSTTWGTDPQAGYAIIRPGGGCPACESLRQVMGGG